MRPGVPEQPVITQCCDTSDVTVLREAIRTARRAYELSHDEGLRERSASALATVLLDLFQAEGDVNGIAPVRKARQWPTAAPVYIRP
jgi:hypothetical protein